MKDMQRNLVSSRAIGWTLFLICAVSFGLMLRASFTDSAIMDELAHIPAGYGYVNNLDYRLNPEHPPLLKAIAAFPLLFFNPHFPTESRAWTTDVNGQWDMGAKFLYESGNDADQIVRWARLGPMLLTILLILLIYAWSSELLGSWWALVPTFLFALSPTVLAHGHYVTTDVAAAFGVFLATWYFVKFLVKPNRHTRFFAALTFGVAAIAKFSTVLLVPYFIFLLVVYYVASVVRDWKYTESATRLKKFFLRGWNYAGSLAVIFVLGYVIVVYPAYFLFTVNYPVQKQVSDTKFILGSFAGGPTPEGQVCKPARCLADLNIWMAGNPALRPFAEYMLGVLMVVQRSAGGNTAYFLGQVSGVGSPWYFPLVYLIKEPLPIIFAVFIAIIMGIIGIARRTKDRVAKIKDRVLDYLTLNFSEFAMLVFIVLYWAYSIRSPLNIGFRHLLPTLPFIYILVASFWKGWVTKIDRPSATIVGLNRLWAWIQAISKASLKYLVLMILLVWFFFETLLAAPYFLSYFNQIGGGVAGGYRYVTDSNYDWGQDLLRLKEWVKAHPEVDKIAVDYFGGGSPKYYLGDTSTGLSAGKAVGWSSSLGNPKDKGIRFLAISINTLEGASAPLAPGQPRKPEDEYRWLTTARSPGTGFGNVPEPDFRAGTSIFIYKL